MAAWHPENESSRHHDLDARVEGTVGQRWDRRLLALHVPDGRTPTSL